MKSSWKFVYAAAALCILAVPSMAQTIPSQPDTSANGTLTGIYFVRQVAVSDFDSKTGNAGRARSVTGVATFDGKGGYTFSGVLLDTKAGSKQQPYTTKGTYAVGANGLFQITNLFDTGDTDFGGVGAAGPSAFVASATEGSYNDIMVGIPVPASSSTLRFSGAYRAGYIDYLQGDLSKVRTATFSFNPNSGSLGAITVTGYGANLGGTKQIQNVSGGTYSIDPSTALGTFTFGTPSTSQLISGSKSFYASQDGSIVVGGDPAGFDLLIAVHPYSGANADASYAGTYYYGQLFVQPAGPQSTIGVASNYGTINATGTGVALVHQRYLDSGLGTAYDYTYDSQHSFDSTATAFLSDGSPEFLGAGGQTVVASGSGDTYTLLVGFQSKQYTGTGVFLYPTAVVNGASFAPISNPVAPGEYVTIFGSGMAPGTFPGAGQSLPVPFPTTLGGVQVTVNGKSAPMYYVSPTQISFIVPDFGVTTTVPTNTATIQVINNGTKSNAVTTRIYAAAPGVWTAGSDGISTGRIQKLPDFSLVSAANPVKPGDKIVIYCTGLGPVFPKVADGAAAPSTTLSQATESIYVYIDGQEAPISFAGLTPGFVDLYQINATVPDGVTRGATVYLDIEVDDGLFGFAIAYTSEAKIPIAQ